MKRSEQDRIWEEIFTDESLEAARASSLSAGLAIVGARRRRPRLVAFGGTALIAATAALCLARYRPVRTRVVAAATVPLVVPAHRDAVAFINDDQLLALFANREAALTGATGSQRLILAHNQ